jgi:hypothetical protein
MTKLKSWGTAVTNENCIHEQIKNRLRLENACYHSVQSLLSSCLLSKNLRIKIHKTINLPVVFYGCGTWSFTLREEHRSRVSENRVRRRVFGAEREKVAGGWRRLHNEKLHNLYASPNIVRVIKSRKTKWAGHVALMGVVRNVYKIMSRNVKGRDHSEDIGVDGKIILECILGM